MGRSNSYGIVPRRWSDGQDSMQFGRLSEARACPKTELQRSPVGAHAKHGITGRDLIVIQEALVDCCSEPLTTSIPAHLCP